jgi:hypothetical protein
MAYNSDSDSSASSASSPSQEQVRKVRLAQIFIIKIDPLTNCIVSILPWDGTDPKDGCSILLAYRVKISDNTYDAYTPITAMVSQTLDWLERRCKNSRTMAPERSFKDMRGKYPSGDSFSFLFVSVEHLKPKRTFPPYESPNLHGRIETSQDLLLEHLMRKTSRHPWRRDDFKIYALNEETEYGRPKSCWYLLNGPDTYDDPSPYIEVVKASELPLDNPSDTTKKYRVLHYFTPRQIDKRLLSTGLGTDIENFRPPRTSSMSPPPRFGSLVTGQGIIEPIEPIKQSAQDGGKSRRRLKRRFKRKTIKRINKRNKRKTIKRINKRNKRKTIKRRFKKR